MIRYWWSDDRKWFHVEIDYGAGKATVILTPEEADALADEAMKTESFLALVDEGWERVQALLEKRRREAGTSAVPSEDKGARS